MLGKINFRERKINRDNEVITVDSMFCPSYKQAF